VNLTVISLLLKLIKTLQFAKMYWVETIVGSGEDGDTDGVGEEAAFYKLSGITISHDKNNLFAVGNVSVRKISLLDRRTSTIAGVSSKSS
jgi:hypothetical protein